MCQAGFWLGSQIDKPCEMPNSRPVCSTDASLGAALPCGEVTQSSELSWVLSSDGSKILPGRSDSMEGNPSPQPGTLQWTVALRGVPPPVPAVPVLLLPPPLCLPAAFSFAGLSGTGRHRPEIHSPRTSDQSLIFSPDGGTSKNTKRGRCVA